MYDLRYFANDVTNLAALVAMFSVHYFVVAAGIVWLAYKLAKFAKEYEFWQSESRKE